MNNLKLKIDTKEINRLRVLLSPSTFRKESRAMLYVATKSAASFHISNVAKRYQINAKGMRTLSSVHTEYNDLVSIYKVSSKRKSLVKDFKATSQIWKKTQRSTQSGKSAQKSKKQRTFTKQDKMVSAHIIRNQASTIKTGFIAKANSNGYVNVFKRSTKQRYPLKASYAPQEATLGTYHPIVEATHEKMYEAFAKELERRIDKSIR